MFHKNTWSSTRTRANVYTLYKSRDLAASIFHPRQRQKLAKRVNEPSTPIREISKRQFVWSGHKRASVHTAEFRSASVNWLANLHSILILTVSYMSPWPCLLSEDVCTGIWSVSSNSRSSGAEATRCAFGKEIHRFWNIDLKVQCLCVSTSRQFVRWNEDGDSMQMKIGRRD